MGVKILGGGTVKATSMAESVAAKKAVEALLPKEERMYEDTISI